jgi:hypothetical protein
MKKVIRLTESDLVRIIKRVISEQTKDGPVDPKKYSEYSIDVPKNNLGIQPGVTDQKTFLDGFSLRAFNINAEGWEFPIVPGAYEIQKGNTKYKLSFEPFDPRKTLLLKITKSI